MGDRPLFADRRQPGRDPARVQRGSPRLSLGREGVGDAESLLVARGLRRNRASPGRREWAADRRWLQPRQPALGRGRGDDPHGEPHRGREEGKPGLPRLPLERIQRQPRARAVRLGSRPRARRGGAPAAARRAAARASRRHLSADASRDVRDRPRPRRVRRPHRHDAGAPGRVRDLCELRRGRPPLGPRARRHDGGVTQARPPVRPYRQGAPLRPPSIFGRRALRPRPDPGCDVQAAKRLRARRPRRAVAGRRRSRRGRRRRRAERDGAAFDRRGNGP